VTANKPPSTKTLERGEHSTGLFRKIGADGVSQLEEVAPPGAPPPEESGLHKLLDAQFDKDRRTEVGGPPTGQVPKSEPLAEVRSQTTYTGPRRRRLAIALAAIGLAGGGLGVWALTRDRGGDHGVTEAPADAPPGNDKGEFEIDPDPEHATGTVTGPDGIAHAFGPTLHAKPTRLRVNAKVIFHVHIDRAGFRAFDDDRKVAPGETMVLAPRLQKLGAILHVVTIPLGAQVALGNKVLGESPLVRDDLEPAEHVELTITHAGYDPQRVVVRLVGGEQRDVQVTLKAAIHFGLIRVSVTGGWGDIYFKGARVGRAGPDPIRLPVGTQIIHLRNPAAGREWNATCEVVEGETKLCSTALPN
jgi:hypothetical protein